MSLHTPPSTYILRDFHDVEPLLSISFFPQTIAWKVIALALIIVAIAGFILGLRRIYNNRYRGQASKAIHAIPINSKDYAQQLFQVMKSVFTYLSAQHTNTFDEAFFSVFECYNGKQKTLSPEIRKAWTQSLLSSTKPLNAEQKLVLKHYCLDWLKQHQREASNEL